MADLVKIEKIKLERILGMGGGYVLDFSNNSFDEFVLESTGLSIYDNKYDHESGYKANRLRKFWMVESNFIVGKLLDDLLEYWFEIEKFKNGNRFTDVEIDLYEYCKKISAKLRKDIPIENIDALKPNSEDVDFSRLCDSIKESIYKNEPEIALDRLHTFVIKYLKNCCDNYNIAYTKDIPLHSLLGMYIKALEDASQIESEMTKRILKSSISVLESFNDIRNNKSFAHDNSILNYNESILIFNDIANVIRFIDSINTSSTIKAQTETKWNDLPF